MRKLTLGLYHHPSTKIVPRMEEITVNTHSLSQICITVFWAPSSVQKLGLFDFYSNAERKIIHALNSRLFTNHAFNPDHSVNMKAWNASWLCLSDKGWSCCLYRFGLSLADSVSAYSDPISLLLFTIGKLIVNTACSLRHCLGWQRHAEAERGLVISSDLKSW